jgi:hypothetical protein
MATLPLAPIKSSIIGSNSVDSPAWFQWFQQEVDFTNGVSSNLANTTANVTTILNTMPVSFISTAQTITANGTLSLPHGLVRANANITPKIVQAYIQNVTPEANYSANDLLQVPTVPDYLYTLSVNFANQTFTFLQNQYGCSVVPDTANLNISFGTNANTFNIMDKTSRANFNITNSNWKIYFTALG